VASELVSVIVTLAVGTVVSRTVNWAVPQPSVVVRPAVGVTTKPAASLSRLTAATSGGFRPLYFGSLLASAAVTIV